MLQLDYEPSRNQLIILVVVVVVVMVVRQRNYFIHISVIGCIRCVTLNQQIALAGGTVIMGRLAELDRLHAYVAVDVKRVGHRIRYPMKEVAMMLAVDGLQFTARQINSSC